MDSLSTQPVKILLLENDASFAELIRKKLSHHKEPPFQVEWHQSLEEGFKFLSKQKVDLVLTSLFLPDCEGIDTLSSLQAKLPEIPIITFAAVDDEKWGRELVRQGAQDYFVKSKLEDGILAHLILRTMERSQLKSDLDRVTQDLRESQGRIKTLTEVDPLTELMNRRGLEHVLSREIAWARREGSNLIGITLDLDNFNRINEDLGRSVGDAVLKEVSQKLQRTLRKTDYVARIGSDEFFILLPQTRTAEGMLVAEKLRHAISETPFAVAFEDFKLTASLGVVSVMDEISSLDELLKKAHLILYQSKRAGKNRVSSDQQAPVSNDGLTESLSDIVEAICRGEVVRAVKQALYRFEDETTFGFEFLSRLSVVGLEMPDDFFRVCMEANVLTAVDYQCLKTCLKAAAPLTKDYRCHLNLFPSTLVEIPPTELIGEFLKNGKGESFCVEISEQQIIGDPSHLAGIVDLFRKSGIRIAVDDVGFGRSCLESLILLEPDIMKIDKKCVIGIAQDKWRERAVSRLMRVAESLNAEVIAEGIETREDLEKLKAMGVRYGQGFLWGKPA